MPAEYVIDGYNLLHNAGLARGKYKPGEFDRARDRLLRRLRDSLTEEERTHTFIIFDAQYAESSDRRPLNLYGMTVLFSPRGRQADDLIEILLSAHQTPRDVTVVSSDHRLQRAARAARASSISSDSFLVELDERKLKRPDVDDEPETKQSRSTQKTFDSGSSEDVDQWLKEFGEIDVQSITKEVVKEQASRQKSDVPVEKPGSIPETQPLTPNPSSKVQPPSPERPQPQETTPPDEVLDQETQSTEEVSFWEKRIQEMLREEDFDPKKRRRK
ncbi:NYN domain-containing protein [Planctomicrobium sp. SH661]|uniref:NYN domain-containing protein n=1 Tax=Planctomicrobium sp. SH661 TaxID=3448124 RepID=UPI003F5C3ABD